jgi:hypothetical protein
VVIRFAELGFAMLLLAESGLAVLTPAELTLPELTLAGLTPAELMLAGLMLAELKLPELMLAELILVVFNRTSAADKSTLVLLVLAGLKLFSADELILLICKAEFCPALELTPLSWELR